MRRSLLLGVLLGVLLAGCTLGKPVPAATIESAALSYLDRLHPGRHGAPVCGTMATVDLSATCDVIVDDRLRRLACTRGSTSDQEPQTLSCAYLHSL